MYKILLRTKALFELSTFTTWVSAQAYAHENNFIPTGFDIISLHDHMIVRYLPNNPYGILVQERCL